MRPVLLLPYCLILTFISSQLRAEGLISRLPVDGSKVMYDLKSTTEMEAEGEGLPGLAKKIDVQGTISISSVGRIRIDQQECRWLEVRRDIPEQNVKSILKLLVPETNFGRGRDPFSQILRMENWSQGGMANEPELIVEPARKHYEIERYRSFIPEKLLNAKPLGRRIVKTPLGPIECEGWVGAAELPPSSLFPGSGGEWAWKATVEVMESDRSPFGVASLTNYVTGYETVGNTGKRFRFKTKTTLVVSAVGNDVIGKLTSPASSRSRVMDQAIVMGKVTDPNGKAIPSVRVLFQIPGSPEVLAAETAADGTYRGKSPLGTITVRVTHRSLDPDGNAKAVLLLEKEVEVRAGENTFNLVNQQEHPAMRRLNFQLHTLIIAVTLAVLLLVGGMLAIRSITYSFWADSVAKKRNAYLADIQALERRAGEGLTAKESELLAYGRRMMEYLTLQQARYERTAHFPWLPTEIDPPSPQ